MSELPKSSPLPPSVPPVIDPDRFGDYPVFRETFLFFVTDPEANGALRKVGQLLDELVLECWGRWPSHPGGFFPARLKAAVADLRQIQGSLQEWTGPAFSLEDEDGAEVALAVGELADRLELALDRR